MLTRKVGNSVSPVVELTKTEDGKYSLSSNSAFKNTSIKFNLNEEFDEETPDGRKVKSTITQEGNKLIHVQNSDKLSTTIVREFQPDELKMVKPKRLIKTPSRNYTKIKPVISFIVKYPRYSRIYLAYMSNTHMRNAILPLQQFGCRIINSL